MKHNLTISNIAEEAGFSRSTVGHVLNGRAKEMRISVRTAGHIREIARKHNFSPNPLARGLRGAQTRTVGILWSLAGPHGSESTLRKLSSVVGRHDYVSYLFDHNSNPDIIVDVLQNMTRRGADGIIMQVAEGAAGPSLMDYPRVAELLREFSFCILVSPELIECDADLIVHDRKVALRECVQHLLQTGRRRLVYALGDKGSNRQKVNAFLDMVRTRGQGVSGEVVGLDQLPPTACISKFSQYQELVEADAIIFSTDEYAAACLQWLDKGGKRCPEDVAVIGFNNSDFSLLLRPALASVDRSVDDLVTHVDELLESRLSRDGGPSQTRHVPMRFIWRASAGGCAR